MAEWTKEPPIPIQRDPKRAEELRLIHAYFDLAEAVERITRDLWSVQRQQVEVTDQYVELALPEHCRKAWKDAAHKSEPPKEEKP